MIATGAPLPETLAALVRIIEAQAPGMLGSILLLDEDGVHVRHGAAPGLPDEFNAAVDGQPIGPAAGSCGTAVYRKATVYVEDIAADPLWDHYRAAALPHGLRACWSTPIFDEQHRVLGTFAMYYRQPGLPQPEHLKLINIVTHLAAIAIGRQRKEAVLQSSEARFRALIESSPVALAMNDEHGNVTLLNHKFIETIGYTLADIPTLDKWWLLAYPDPTYRQRVIREWQAAVEKAQRDNTELEPLEYKVACSDGSVRDIRFSMAPIGGSSLVILYDITAHKQVEGNLQWMIERFDLATRAGGLGVWDWDVVNDQLVWDDRMYSLYGIRKENFTGAYEAWMQGVHPEDMDRCHRETQLALRGENQYDTEFRVVWPDSTVRHIKAYGLVVRDPAGNPLRMTGINSDITEHKKAEEERQKFVMLADSSSEFIGMCDLDMKPNYVNPAGQRMVGLPDMAAACRIKVQDYFFPEDQRFIGEEFFPQVLREGQGNVEIRLRHFQTGEPIWVYYYLFSVRDPSGTAVGWATVSRDITERKRTENEIRRLNAFYAALSETEKALVRVTEIDILFQQICEIAVRLAGFRLAWIGVPDGDWFKVAAVAGPSKDYLEGLRISIRADFPEGRGPSGRAFRSGEHYVCNDLGVDPFSHPWRARAAAFGIKSSAVFPLHSEGNVVGILNVDAADTNIFQDAETRLLDSMAEDISFALDHLHQQSKLQLTLRSLQQAKEGLELRVLERTAQLEAARDKAEVADRVKSTFLATMSHELRTPLNSIIGFTGVLLQGLAGTLNKEQEKQLGIVKGAGQHLLELVNDVLDISKIEAGELNITLEQVDLPALLLRMVERFQPMADVHGIALKLEMEPGIMRIRSNGRRLEQVIWNLLSNALKFTDSGEVRLFCHSENGFVKISVSDTGIGIAAEDVAKLFRPFVQLDVRPERVAQGTGLGLVISRRIVEMLGGEMGVESVKGAGSRFYFTLPLMEGSS